MNLLTVDAEKWENDFSIALLFKTLPLQHVCLLTDVSKVKQGNGKIKRSKLPNLSYECDGILNCATNHSKTVSIQRNPAVLWRPAIHILFPQCSWGRGLHNCSLQLNSEYINCRTTLSVISPHIHSLIFTEHKSILQCSIAHHRPISFNSIQFTDASALINVIKLPYVHCTHNQYCFIAEQSIHLPPHELENYINYRLSDNFSFGVSQGN